MKNNDNRELAGLFVGVHGIGAYLPATVEEALDALVEAGVLKVYVMDEVDPLIRYESDWIDR